MSVNVSALCANLSAVSARSVGNVSTHGLQSVINALSNRISNAVFSSNSVTSANLASVNAELALSLNAATSAIPGQVIVL